MAMIDLVQCMRKSLKKLRGWETILIEFRFFINFFVLLFVKH